jgi:hypothetical protein
MSDAPEVTVMARKVKTCTGDWGSMWISQHEAQDFESPSLGTCNGKVSVATLLMGGSGNLATRVVVGTVGKTQGNHPRQP